MENMDTPPFSGMGLLTGKRMYEDGANVVLVDCDKAALENVKSEFTGGGRIERTEVADR